MTRHLGRSVGARLILALACSFAATASLAPRALLADEAANSDAAGKGVVENEALFKIPAGDDAAKIQEFMTQLAQTAPEAESEKDQIAFSVKALNTLVEAGDRLLAAKPNDEQAEQAFAYQIEALQALVALEQPDAAKKLEKVLATARSDKREPIMGRGWQNTIMFVTSRWPTLDPQERQAFLDEIVKKIEAGPQPIDLPIVQITATRLDGVDDKAVVGLLEKVIPLFEKSTDEGVQEKAKEANLAGMLRRMTLVGSPLEISGTFLDGKKLDWESYRGKVVLVDFWATWCAPCRAEIPNILEMYNAYHDKGFEVIGVSLDATPEAAQKYVDDNKLPWSSLFPRNEDEREWDNPLVAYYGITGIPTVMLVGKDGKVVTMDARGPQLEEELKALLGDPKPREDSAATEKAAAK